MYKTFLLILSLLGSSVALSAQQRSIDAEKSGASFVISNMAVNKVGGTFTGMEGEIIFNPENPLEGKFNACLKAATVHTGSKKRDEHLRKEDFFHVEKYPDICFVSSAIQQDGESWVAVGDLTLHGITKEVKIPFFYVKNTLRGSLTLNRLDYEVGKGTGTFMVGDEVILDIVCTLN